MLEKLKKTEFWLSLAGLIGTVATAVLGAGVIAEGTLFATILTVAAIVCSYVTGRSWVKASEAKKPPVRYIVTADSNARSIHTPPPPPGEVAR